MDCSVTSSVGIAVIVGTVGFKWVKHWLTKRDLISDYIQVASDIQRLVETDQPLELDDVAKFEDIEIKPESKRVVKHHGLFKSYLVQIGKAKFGTPSRTAANELVVRKYLYDECVSSGLKARHIMCNLDFATQMVFVPCKEELLALAVRQTHLTKTRDGIRKELGVSTRAE